MNVKQYETILSALADKIKAQEDTISLQKWQIEKLEKSLAEAEEIIKQREYADQHALKSATKLEIR